MTQVASPNHFSRKFWDAYVPDTKTCPICGTIGGSVFSCDVNRRDRLPIWGAYVRCVGCTHLYMTPMPTSRELAAFYEQLRQVQAKASRRHPVKQLAHALLARIEYTLLKRSMERHFALHYFLPSLPEQEGCPRLLDMGCGEGATLAGLSGRGWAIHGVDVSETAVESARKRIPSGTFVVGDLVEAARSFGPFDLVRLDNVFEHTIDPVSVLQAAYHLLRPGGHLVIYVPHGNSLSLRWFRSRSVSHWVPFHLHLFTPESLTLALELAGFHRPEFRYNDPPSWWTLTMSQVFHPQWDLSTYAGTATAASHLRLAALPFRILSWLGGGEELVAFVQKK